MVMVLFWLLRQPAALLPVTPPVGPLQVMGNMPATFTEWGDMVNILYLAWQDHERTDTTPVV